MPDTLPLPESPRQGVERFTLPAVPLAVARHEGITLGDLRNLYDSTYGALGAAIGAGRFVPVGPGLAVYHGDPQATFDMEIGFPVAEPLAAAFEEAGITIHPSALPAGPAAGASHLGSFDGLGDAWGRIMQDLADSGDSTEVTVEIYATEPSPDMNPDDLRTDLIAALKPRA